MRSFFVEFMMFLILSGSSLKDKRQLESKAGISH